MYNIEPELIDMQYYDNNDYVDDELNPADDPSLYNYDDSRYEVLEVFIYFL